MIVIKRDGREVQFDKNKIVNAILKAFVAVDGDITDYAKQKAENIASYIETETNKDKINVEEIQDYVEHGLMSLKRKDVAKAYILYRNERNNARRNTIEQTVEEIVGNCSEYWSTENSNKDAKLATTQRDYIAGAVSTDICKRRIFPHECIEAHEEGIIHIHDMDYILQPIYNCCLINLEDMLQNGTVISNTKIDKPHKFSTACNIATQIIAQVASSQYGGQSISLAHLSPFVEDTRAKFKSDYPDVSDYVIEEMVKNDIKSGVQTLQYQIITLMTTNGQAPFITIYMNLAEAPEGKQRDDLAIVIQEVLKQRIQGVKNEAGVWITPAFPKLIYALDDMNITPDSKYYYLTRLAAECTAKRMVPDYISNKVQRKLKQGDTYTCMGCVVPEEVVTYRYNGRTYVESIGRMWNRLMLSHVVQPHNNGQHIDLNKVEIWDSGEQKFVPCQRIIRNKTQSWLELTFSNGRILDCTPDHPFETQRGQVRADQLTSDDVIKIDSATAPSDESYRLTPDTAWLLGLILCDGSYRDHIVVSLGPDEQDIVERVKSVAKTAFNADITVKEQSRGNKGRYIDVNFHACEETCTSHIASTLISMFEGLTKSKRHIPAFIFSTSYKTRLAFLAGMIDADGYVNSSMKLTKVQIGSTNRELSEQQMLLAQSCGMQAYIYRNHYNANKHDNIRYRVEFVPTQELIDLLVSTKKRNHAKNFIRTNASIATMETCSLTNCMPYTFDGYSYDVTTASEHFTVAGIYSHNCRSFLTVDTTRNGFDNIANAKNYDPNKPKYYGRFNQGVVTINLPDIALSSKGDFDKFWEIYDERLELCHKALKIKHNRLVGTSTNVAPILWQNGAIARLGKDDTIDKLLYGGYSTISLGYAGLYECVKYMTGKSHTSKEGKEFALSVMQKLNDACNKWKAEENIAYSVYGSPIESTSYKFAKCLKNRFGNVPGITDHDYVTNSYHVNVREHIDAFTKLKFESEFQELSPGGAISYVEVPDMSKNVDAVLEIINFIYDNIMYAEINSKFDYCQCCGYSGEIQIKGDPGHLYWECPNCGNTDQNKMNVARRTCG